MCLPNINKTPEGFSETVQCQANARLAVPTCGRQSAAITTISSNSHKFAEINYTISATVKCNNCAGRVMTENCENSNSNNKKSCHSRIVNATEKHNKNMPHEFHTFQKARKTKSYVFLLVVISAIFVQISDATPVKLSGKRLIHHTSEYRERYHQELLEKERARVQTAPPQHHRHHLHLRSVSNMNDGEQNGDIGFCKKVNFDLIKKAASAALDTINAYLDDFARYRFNEEAKNAYLSWKPHSLDLNHPYQHILVRQHHSQPHIYRFDHIDNQPISREMIERELNNTYVTLKILQHVFKENEMERKMNETTLRHKYPDSYEKMNEIMNRAGKKVDENLSEVEIVMRTINMPLPEEINNVSYNKTGPEEWLMLVENIGVMQYLTQLYEKLSSMCHISV